MTGQGYRVLYVNAAAERGGGEVILLNLLRYLPSTAQAEVALLSQGSLAARLRALGIRTYVLPAGRFRQPWRLLRTLWHLVRLMWERDITLVDSAGAKGHLYGGLAALVAGIPAVWRLQDVPSPRDPWIRLAGLVPAAGIAALSKASLDAYAHLQSLPAHTSVVYPGVEFSDGMISPPSTPGTSPSSTVHEQLAISAETAVVTMVGRLQHWKGQHVFLEAAAKVLEQRRDVHFLVVGGSLFGIEPEYARQLHDMVVRAGIVANVTFMGQRDDVARIIAATDILVHASITPESFGQVIVEGMTQGKAVIASAAGGPLEIITDGVDGVLAPPGDATALAQAVANLLDDPERRRRLGQAARLTVQKRFTVQEMATGFARFYEAVLTGAARS